MGELDFTGKTVLVVGGSSGIGNGIAHGFRERGAQVHVWGTRASARLTDPGSPAPRTLGEETWKWLYLQPLTSPRP